MNSITLLIFSIIWLLFAYRFYGKGRIEKLLIAPLDTEATPAHTVKDATDFYPAPRLVLFGHHFSSIAGAGPIVGPIIAVAAFGWGATVIWLLVGGVFIGAVHDYLSLMISVRHNGASLPETTERYISKRAKIIFLSFVWFALVLIAAVFGVFAANTMISMPEIVIPTFLIIPLAITFGLLQKKQFGSLTLRTLFAIALLIFIIYLGYQFPIILGLGTKMTYLIWFSLLMLYGVIASVTPVWILLQPRDYISSWVLILGLGFALVGVFISQPEMQAPVISTWNSAEQGPLVPFLFIIVACGAISGFHSLVASGTSSRQLSSEKDALPVAYGGMLTETLVGIIAVIIAGAALKWSGPDNLHSLLDPALNGSPLHAFGAGFGKLCSFIFDAKLGALIGITMINVFIMTTLDTTIRLGRFITAELRVHLQSKNTDNKIINTLIPVVPAFILGASGEWKSVWPVFGAANQLVGALALVAISAFLYRRGKSLKFTLPPTAFMILATIAALLWLAKRYLFGSETNFFLGSLSIVLITLALFVVYEGVKLFKHPRQPG